MISCFKDTHACMRYSHLQLMNCSLQLISFNSLTTKQMNVNTQITRPLYKLHSNDICGHVNMYIGL